MTLSGRDPNRARVRWGVLLVGILKSATNHNSKNYSYTLDGNGNIKQTVRDGVTTSFGHNQADQLCWSVNAASTAACGSPPTGAATYSHDADGNMVSSSASFSAAYNVRQQATTMTSLTGTNSSGMVYSGPNQFERVTAGATTYLTNALGVGAETTASATTRFRRDADGGLHSERLPGSNAIHYYVFDGLGSVAGLSDAAGTTPLPTTYSYDPYGLTTTSGTANVNPWKYASTYADATGFYKMGMRYYSPRLMRWSQRDPVEQLTDPVQAMLYGYAGLGPLNNTDPTGTHILEKAWNKTKSWWRENSGDLNRGTRKLIDLPGRLEQAWDCGWGASASNFGNIDQCDPLEIFGGFDVEPAY